MTSSEQTDQLRALAAQLAAALADCGFEEIRDQYHDDEGEQQIGELTVQVDAHIISARKSF